MHQVEELADRIALINKGKTVLYGGLEEIKHRYASNAVLIHSLNDLPLELPGVREVVKQNNHTLLKLETGKTPQDVLSMLVEKKIALEQFEIAMPTLDEIFIQVVQSEGTGE
jgi:ABC-2 type transport system ATP-binding protein